jgi:transcriptional regulator with XRE-family HTH domain
MVAHVEGRPKMALLGKNLRRLRQERGLSQGDLSRKTLIPQPTISMLETGVHSDIHAASLIKIAGALEVSLDKLVYGEFAKPPKGKAPESRSEEIAEARGKRRDGPTAELDPLYAFLAFANDYAHRWEEKVESGDFDLSSLGEFMNTAQSIGHYLGPLNDEETKDLPQQPFSYGYPAARTGVPLMAFARLASELPRALEGKLKKTPFGEKMLQGMVEADRRARAMDATERENKQEEVG